MSGTKKPEFVRLRPVRGKYTEVVMGGGSIQRIWELEPGNEDSGVRGSEVPYTAAMILLARNPPVVTLAPCKDAKGKAVQQLSKEDLELLARSRTKGRLLPNLNVKKAVAPMGDGDMARVMELMEAQSQKIDALSGALAAANSANAAMAERLGALEGSGAPGIAGFSNGDVTGEAGAGFSNSGDTR